MRRRVGVSLASMEDIAYHALFNGLLKFFASSTVVSLMAYHTSLT